MKVPITLVECDDDKIPVPDGLDTMLLVEEAPLRNWKTRPPIDEQGINGNPLTAYKHYPNYKIKLRETMVPYSRNVELRKFYDGSVNNDKLYLFTDQYDNVGLCEVSDIQVGKDIGDTVEFVDLIIKIRQIVR